MPRSPELQVIVFTDTYFETNGVGSYYRTVLEWCRRTEGIRAIVICPTGPDGKGGQVGDDVVSVRPTFPFRNPVYSQLTMGYFPQAKLCKIVQGISGPKVIHVATSGALGVAGARVARRLGLPLVGCYHTDLQRYGRLYGQSLLGRPGAWLGGWITRVCDKLAYARCEALSVPSASAAESTKSFFPGTAEVIPHPIDVNWFRPGSSRVGSFRDKYLTKGKILAAIVGRVAKEKNLDLICELLGNDERIDTVFVGDGPYAPALIQKWGARVTGFLHGAELLEAYQQSDLFIQLSTTETFGLSLAEALSCGLPAVVVRSRGFVENLGAGHGVEILDHDELPTLGDRCVALTSDRKRYQESSRRARDLGLRCAADAVLPRFRAFHEAVAR
jgi:glycosyltransferase involved in cell wall biosynthesis